MTMSGKRAVEMPSRGMSEPFEAHGKLKLPPLNLHL